SHFVDATINQVTWYLTAEGGPHTQVFVYIFGLAANGTPDSDQLLHVSPAQPNIDLEWNTYTMEEPLEAPDGFFVGVALPNVFHGLGTDDGLPDGDGNWPFIPGTQFAALDYTNNAWDDIGDLGFPFNLTVRAYGALNSQLPQPVQTGCNVSSAGIGSFSQFAGSESAIVSDKLDRGQRSVNIGSPDRSLTAADRESTPQTMQSGDNGDAIRDNLQGYVIYRQINNVGDYEEYDTLYDHEAVTYTDVDVELNTVYCYRIAALY
ncbi:MAG: hypothetical protein GY869_10030, partial [Planctomycetes bacterium]|nr:hypothetical protein [Planctomycetota bacterium]